MAMVLRRGEVTEPKTPEEIALHACARAWVPETPDAVRMETVSRVAAALREYGARIEAERDELLLSCKALREDKAEWLAAYNQAQGDANVAEAERDTWKARALAAERQGVGLP